MKNIYTQKIKKIKKLYISFLLLLVIILGFYARFNFAANKPMWLDEVFTFQLSQLPLKDLILQNNQYWDFSHPTGYYIFIKLWKTISISELWLRTPSLIFYIISTLFLLKISKFFKSPFITFFLLSYFSFHPMLIDLGSELRMYPLVIAIYSAIIYFIFKLVLSNKKSNKELVTITILSIFGFYIDYSFIWLIGSMFILVAILKLNKHYKANELLKMITAIFIGISPQLYILLSNFNKIVNLNTHLSDSLDYFDISLSHFTGFYFFEKVGLFLLIATGITMIVITLKSFKKNNNANIVYLFITLNLLFPIGAILFYSLVKQPLFNNKNLIVAIISFLISVSIILYKLKSNLFIKIFSFLILIFFINKSFLLTQSGYFVKNNINWKDVRYRLETEKCDILLLEKEKNNEELIILKNYYSNYPYRINYFINNISSNEKLEKYIKNNKNKCSILFKNNLSSTKLVKKLSKNKLYYLY